MKLLMRDSLKFEEGMRQGIIEGERQGIIKGERQGIIKGTLKEKFSTAKRMLSSGFKIPEIMKLTELSLEDLNSLLQA